MSLSDILSRHGSIELHCLHDAATGLRAFIAIDDTRLGPAVGGARLHAYASEDEAIHDVVRLARGMTAKAALAGLSHGGGKAVLWGDAKRIADRAAYMRAFGGFVDVLGGRYLTCEDVGISIADIDVIHEVTPHCVGYSQDKGSSGDPSPFTALGVRRGIEAVAEVVLGRSDLAGIHVAIQGVGAVGFHLAEELHALGCRLTVADIDAERARRAADELGAAVASVDDIAGIACDIYAPCALGGAINDSTVGRLACRAVAGGANNQLATPEMGKILAARDIFYAPDYAINAGGLINVASEWKGYDPVAARAKTMRIRETIADIAYRSRDSGRRPEEIADRMVADILARAGSQPLVSTSSILARPAASRARDTAV
ncbi:MAG TPA: Glu/Leu/Phe/Val dehydrogenase dimerization domain-containing protein [Haliangiales bacterium]|nr:Glu/Leu/Phe/Val dehydrogenase dimerization domain-containing protein [Haliangiales bacterium]